MEKRGIIVGGGIGGLVTAIALQRQGIRANVYEQAPVIQEVGAGLALTPNALYVFEQLGLGNAVREISWPLSKGLVSEANGRILQVIDAQALTKRYGFGVLVVHRGKLQKLLVDALSPDQIHTGKQLTEFFGEAHQIRAHFADGSTADGAFLIGADGIWSVVRRCLFGNQPLRYSGQSCWRAIVDCTLPADKQTTSVEYWGYPAGLRIGVVPCGSNQVYLYITVATPAEGRDVPQQIIPYLQSLATTFEPVVASVIQALDENRIHRADLYDLPTLPAWSRGRCTLLGDAAHATTPNLGQGACQAIEDAFVVAACLTQTDNVAAAFKKFEELRKAKANRVVMLSRQIGRAVNLPGWVKPLTFAVMRAIPQAVGNRQFDAIYNMDYVRNLTLTASQSHPVPAG